MIDAAATGPFGVSLSDANITNVFEILNRPFRVHAAQLDSFYFLGLKVLFRRNVRDDPWTPA
jgi:hypothetical protein